MQWSQPLQQTILEDGNIQSSWMEYTYFWNTITSKKKIQERWDLLLECQQLYVIYNLYSNYVFHSFKRRWEYCSILRGSNYLFYLMKCTTSISKCDRYGNNLCQFSCIVDLIMTPELWPILNHSVILASYHWTHIINRSITQQMSLPVTDTILFYMV